MRALAPVVVFVAAKEFFSSLLVFNPSFECWQNPPTRGIRRGISPSAIWNLRRLAVRSASILASRSQVVPSCPCGGVAALFLARTAICTVIPYPAYLFSS